MTKFLMLPLAIFLFLFNSCGDEVIEEVPTNERKETTPSVTSESESRYRVEIIFDGAYENYSKEVILSASKPNGGLAKIVDSSGKVLSDTKLNDKTYSFSAKNIFTINEDAKELKLNISVSNASSTSNTPDAKIHVKVYKDGELLSEESGNATREYEYSSSSTLS